MIKNFIRNHIVLVSIITYIIIFTIIQLIKPKFLYNTDGSLLKFGVGYRKKTIFPIWLLSIILGIVCYLAVLYYLEVSKIFN